MKRLKQTLLIIVFMSSLVGVAQKNYTEASVKDALKQGFAEFVDNLRPAYSNGDTYREFKDKVFFGVVNPPNYTLPPVPAEGENLLQKAYQFLVANYSSRQLLEKADYKTFGKAILYINNYSNNNNKSVQDAEVALFGGNSQLISNNALLSNTRGVCKWWQLWCHLDQIFGGGGAGQLLQAIVQFIIILIL